MKETDGVTPDGRYLVVQGHRWRRSNPGLPEEERARLVSELMSARRDKGIAMKAGDVDARKAARLRVDVAKVALGERGPVWWTDGALDLNRRMVRNTPYADWFCCKVCGVASIRGQSRPSASNCYGERGPSQSQSRNE